MNYSSHFRGNKFSGATGQYSTTIIPDTGLKLDQKQFDLMNLAISISIESGKILEYTSNKDVDNIKLFAYNLKQKLESLLGKLPASKSTETPSNYVYTGVTESVDFKNLSARDYPGFVSNVIHKSLSEKEEEFLLKSRERAFDKKINDRHLDNGGMAPPKEWRSITSLNLKSNEKNNLIEEMRRLKANGLTMSSSLHHAKPVNIEEFTEPFKFIENVDDYNGSFFITLLKTDVNISNQASLFQIDLSSEKNKCINNDSIILAVFDIIGTTSKGEEKNFLIILNFNKLNGTLEYSHALFNSGKKCQLSTRQLDEMAKFCKSKKIIYKF